jgi:hypothetical protein
LSTRSAGNLAGSVRWAIVPYAPRPPFRIYAGRDREPYLVQDAETLIAGIRRRGGDAELTYLGPAKARPVLILNDPPHAAVQEVTALRLLRFSQVPEHDKARVRQQGDPLLFHLEPGRFDLPEENAAIISALVALHVDAISRDAPAGTLSPDEARLLGERIVRFYGFDVGSLVEQAILDLARRRRQAR